MKFVNEHKTAVALIGCTVLVVILLIFFGTHSSRSTAAEDTVRTIMSPVQGFFGNIGDGFYDLTHCIGEIKELRNHNDELGKNNAELEKQVSDNAEMSEENDRLKRMLELRRDNDEFDMAAANVVADDPSNWFTAFTIDKGRNSGIEEGQAVISADKSLVGKISKVGTNWAEVVTVLDPGFSVGAMVERSRDMGVAEGDTELRLNTNLKLTYLNRETDIEEEDLITTTGLGGVFPSGLNIGTVKSVKEDNVTMIRYAIVEPDANLRNMRQVFVIKNNFDIVADQENENMAEARKAAEDEQDRIDKELSATASPKPNRNSSDVEDEDEDNVSETIGTSKTSSQKNTSTSKTTSNDEDNGEN